MACKQKNNALLLQMSALAYDGDHASKVVVIKRALGVGLAGGFSSERDHPLPSPGLLLAPDCAKLFRSDHTNEGPHGCVPKRRSREEPCKPSRTLKPRPSGRAQQPRTEPANSCLPASRTPLVSALRN